MESNKVKTALLFAVMTIVLIVASRCSIASSSKQRQHAETAEGFYFDAPVTVTAYGGTDPRRALDYISYLDGVFKETYSRKANELAGAELYDCVMKTAELNAKYGGNINITCGELTKLWGISAKNPKVPTDEEISAALQSIEDMPRFGGFFQFTDFGENTRLDFGAVAKGYACDELKKEVDLAAEDCVIVSMNSSALLYGKKPDGTPFKTAIKDPFGKKEHVGYVYTDAAFISTAGGYERFFEQDGVRYEHILDLNTGYPVFTDLASVTVIVPANRENGGLLSDFLSTHIYMEGIQGLTKYLESYEYSVVAVGADGTVYASLDVELEFNDE